MSRMISFFVLVVILAAIGTIFFRVMSGFLVPVFLAALLGVMFQPMHNRIHERLSGWGQYVTAGISTFVVAFIVLGPAILVISLGIFEGITLVNRLGEVSVRDRFEQLRRQMGLNIPQQQDLEKIEETLKHLQATTQRGIDPQIAPGTLENLGQRANRLADYVSAEKAKPIPEFDYSKLDPVPLQKALRDLEAAQVGGMPFDDALDLAQLKFKEFKLHFLGGSYQSWLKGLANPSDEQVDKVKATWLSSGSPLLDLSGDTASVVGRTILASLIIIATLFFLFADGPRLLDIVISFSPLEERYLRELIGEFDRASRAVVLATLLSALAQGLLAGIGYQFVGLGGSVFLLTLMTTILAMVPFLGAASVWITVCLWLYFSEGRLGAAIGMAIYGTLVVSMIDNIIKPLVLHGQSNLHPLLALLSILGGVQVMGPIGILVGPMSVVFVQTLVRILHREYKVFETRMELGDHPHQEEPPAVAEPLPDPTDA